MADPDRHEPPPHALSELFRLVASRRGADGGSSYTAALLAAAPARPGRKLVEEAAECAIEVERGDAAALARESADLVFHLVVLLVAAEVEPAAVYADWAPRP